MTLSRTIKAAFAAFLFAAVPARAQSGAPPLRGEYGDPQYDDPQYSDSQYGNPQYDDAQNARFAPPVYDGDAGLRGAYGPRDFDAARNYYTGALALRPRDDAGLRLAYDRADESADSSWGVGGYWRQSRGETLVEGTARVKLALGDGVNLIGSFDTTSANGKNVRQPDGSFAASDRSVRAGAVGAALDLDNGIVASAEILAGENLLGGRVRAFASAPNGYWDTSVTYHEPYAETAEAIAAHALKDEVHAGFAQNLGDGFWGGAAGYAARYGVHGDADAVNTLGWNANLRYAADFGGLLAGVGYDGLGEYVVGADKFTGAAPTPYTPLSIRTREIHMVTASLSTALLGDFGLDLYGGYALDRYADNGPVAGGALHFRPVRGFDLALGVRYSRIALTQGETGAETLAGLNLDIGFDGPTGLLR